MDLDLEQVDKNFADDGIHNDKPTFYSSLSEGISSDSDFDNTSSFPLNEGSYKGYKKVMGFYHN